MPWINDLPQTEGPNILRSKGIIAFKDEPKRFVFQGVHMILDGDLQRDWKAGEKRESRIVFIGRASEREARSARALNPASPDARGDRRFFFAIVLRCNSFAVIPDAASGYLVSMSASTRIGSRLASLTRAAMAGVAE